MINIRLDRNLTDKRLAALVPLDKGIRIIVCSDDNGMKSVEDVFESDVGQHGLLIRYFNTNRSGLSGWAAAGYVALIQTTSA